MKTLMASTAAFAMMAGLAMAQDVVRLGTEGAYPPNAPSSTAPG
jgi:polar amino acid transport system substrate-binding protein